jgi:signal transduction histidine kinase
MAATGRVAAGDIATPVPLLSNDELGVLSYSFNEMLADLRRHTDELRASRGRIVAAGDGERRRAERDLHDGAQQQLVIVQLKLGMLSRMGSGDPRSTAIVDTVRRGAGLALGELRELARGIYPALLENEGLRGALDEIAARAGIPVRIDCDGVGRYPRELESAVYFCCLESLHNAAKHAGEDARATVSVAERSRSLRFEIADDGRGFDAARADFSSGVQNMVDRLGALGGS